MACRSRTRCERQLGPGDRHIQENRLVRNGNGKETPQSDTILAQIIEIDEAGTRDHDFHEFKQLPNRGDCIALCSRDDPDLLTGVKLEVLFIEHWPIPACVRGASHRVMIYGRQWVMRPPGV
jgi:hypothetical protein